MRATYWSSVDQLSRMPQAQVCRLDTYSNGYALGGCAECNYSRSIRMIHLLIEVCVQWIRMQNT